MEKKEERMRQSAVITRIGCAGVVLVLVLLILAGLMAARADLARKKAVALADLGRIREQVEKAPGLLGRMLSDACSESAREAVERARQGVESLSVTAIEDLDRVWELIEQAWDAVTEGCPHAADDPVFRDFNTEMEGIRNRRSVEKGNYREHATVYNNALKQFPFNLGAEDLKPLPLGD